MWLDGPATPTSHACPVPRIAVHCCCKLTPDVLFSMIAGRPSGNSVLSRTLLNAIPTLLRIKNPNDGRTPKYRGG